MPTNERENARRELARKKDRRTKRIIWVILILIILALFAMRMSEVDFKSIKNRFTDSNGNITISMTTDENAYPYQLDSSSDVSIQSINDKMAVLTSSSLTILNPSDASNLYSFDHGYATPMISYAGNYICLVDQGGTRLRLDTNSANLYEQSLSKTILTADVSNNGSVIYATKSDSAKSNLVVVNKSLKKLLELNIKDGYVVSVAIDPSGKKCAYATVNSSNAVMKTTVHTINIGDSEDIATFTYEGVNILDMKYNASCLYVIGDNALSVITSQKKEHTVFKPNTIITNHYTFSRSNELVLDYSDYVGANENTIAYVKSNAKVKTSIDLSSRVKGITASSKDITVLFPDKVAIYSITKGEERASINCDDSLRSANTLSSKTFVQRGQIIDVLE